MIQLLFTSMPNYCTILHHDHQTVQPTGKSIFFPIWPPPNRQEYPGERPFRETYLENRPSPDGDLVGAFEIKSTTQIHGPHLSGLRSFHNEYPQVPLHVIARVEHPYRIEEVLVLPWKNYLARLPEILG
jgi:hypothetical protein